MPLDPRYLARRVSAEVGLEFDGEGGVDRDGSHWARLRPIGVSNDHAFSIVVGPSWRRLRLSLALGKFAGELLSAMGQAGDNGRSAFRRILGKCADRGAAIDFRVNDTPFTVDAEEAWTQKWSRITLELSKGQLAIGSGEDREDEEVVCRWAVRFAAAVVAILPLEQDEEAGAAELRNYPEGAVSVVQVNRYERDRRNRAAAIAIHGSSCMACKLEFGDAYGEVAEGFIEVHHTTPASQLGDGYIVDPRHDLAPLCPNCHAVAHRRDPPFSVEEIKMFLYPVERPSVRMSVRSNDVYGDTSREETAVREDEQ